MEVDEGSEVGATEREEYYEDLEDEHSDEEGEDDWFLISLTIKLTLSRICSILLGSKAFNVCLTYPRDTGPKSI